MKFGQTLRQRSIPQWAHYNVDYDEIKHLIKERTTDKSPSPVSIPGSQDGDSRWSALEDELFLLLEDQHARVNLFTKSKFGELDRRLDHLTRQFSLLARQLEKSRQLRIAVQRSRKFQKLVETSDEIGEEIQSLSRYSNTQRIAFKKILKKYQKWTGSSRLAMRMNNEIFNHPSSYLKPDYTLLLNKLSHLQYALHHLTTHESNKSGTSSPEDLEDFTNVSYLERNSASLIEDAFRNGTSLDIDMALATQPLGSEGGRAVYWIHPDNVDEVRVLVLRHMRDHGVSRPNSLSRTASRTSIASRQGSISSDIPSETAEGTNAVYFDDLEAFIKEQNTVTLNHTEDTPGSCPSEVMMQINWTKDSKLAYVATSDAATTAPTGKPPGQRTHKFRICRIRRKDIDRALPDGKVPSASEDETPELVEVQKWVRHHSNVKPLVHVTTQRSRYTSPKNEIDAGYWATLDQSIVMSSVNNTSLVEEDETKQSKSDFPHAILELRWEQESVPELIHILNGSYLTERVRGFSLQTHAVHMICCPPQTTKPVWLSVLGRDIRKLPSKQSKSLNKRTVEFPGNSSKGESTSGISVSATSTDGPTSAGLSANAMPSSATSMHNSAAEEVLAAASFGRKKKRRSMSRKDEPLPAHSSRQRYWNEFDDGSDAEVDQVYTIFVDPNTSSGFPGTALISEGFSAVRDSLRASGRKLNQWIRPVPKATDPVRQPLLSDQSRQNSYSYDLEDSSDSESISRLGKRAPTLPRPKIAKRSTAGTARERQQISREIGLFQTYLACFIGAFVLLTITSILHATARRKATFEADIGVVLGVAASLCFGVIALGVMSLRRERLSWLHRMAVALAFGVICVASGLLIASIVNVNFP